VWRVRPAAHEALGMRGMRDGKDEVSIFATLLSAAVVDVVGRIEPDPAVAVLVMSCDA
jgi:hypothetical protein